MSDRMHVYVDLKEMVEKEISNIVKKDELDEKCLDLLDRLVDIAKDIDTIFAMNDYQYDENGYSNRTPYPYYYMDDMPNRMHGNSYRNYNGNMNHNMNNQYSRNNYRSGYSRENSMRDRLEQMMNEATNEHEREAIRNALDRM